MKLIADFHLHSKYSRATSRDMDLENLAQWAKIKGIKVLGTGDFSHPEWFKALKEKLEPCEPGLFKLKKQDQGTRFILTNEISCIYSKTRAVAKGGKEDLSSLAGGKVRKIHLLIFAPSFEIVEKINAHLSWIGNLKADGRPILGLDAKELAKIVLNISEGSLIVPGHLMTPWFSLFGSRSGFDSLEECFDEYSKYIYAGETGLSASPDMLWRMPDGRRITLISNSDSHSPSKLGREANVFDTELSYPAIIEAIKKKDKEKFLYTIEFFPEEGKYHYDGHRMCGICLSPQESRKSGNICPNCGRPLTIGVLSRVEKLADKPAFDKSLAGKPEGAIPFRSLVPLNEIIADALGVLSGAKQVEKEYKNLIEKFDNEFKILLEASFRDLEAVVSPEITEGIIRVREGRVRVEPGYDGIYGKVRIFSKGEQKTISRQKTLF